MEKANMLAVDPRTCSCGTVILYRNTESKEHFQLHLPTCDFSEPVQRINYVNTFKVKTEAKYSMDSITAVEVTSDDINSNKMLFECTLCESLNISPQGFGLHLQENHNVNLPFKCTRCLLSFTALIFLTSHMEYKCYRIDKHAHQPQTCPPLRNEYKQEPLSHLMRNKHETISRCTKCDKTFANHRMLKEHNIIHRRFSCPQCDETFLSPSTLRRHDRIHNRQFSCKECGKAFNDPNRLEWHLTTHTEPIEDGPFTHEQCDEALPTKWQLKQHNEMYHPCEPSSCDKCGKVCPTPYKLTVRHSRIHADRVKAVSCEECNKAYYTRCNLTLHLQQHHVANPYKCNLCRRAFKNEQQYQDHQRMAQCKECTKCFGTSGGLRIHIQSGVHNKNNKKEELSIVCGYCGSKLETRELWVEHIREHQDKGIHICVCGRHFDEKRQYEEHQKYSLCKDCELCFCTPSMLKAHLASSRHSSKKSFH